MIAEFLAFITGTPRYFPNEPYPKNSWTGFLFRAWENLAGIPCKIVAESKTDWETGVHISLSFRDLCTHTEEVIRKFFRDFKPVALPMPMLTTGAGINIPFFPYNLAVGFVSATDIHFTNATTSVDAGTGSNRIIIFAVCGDTSDNMSGVTWNLEALTKGLTQNFAAIGRYNYIWYLHNPTGTGAQDQTISGSTSRSVGTTMVYSSVSGIPTDFVQSTAGPVTSIANSHTAVDGDWLTGGAGNDVSTLGFGANTTGRSISSSQGQADSNGVASPTALNYTLSSGNAAAYGCVISPAAAGTASGDSMRISMGF